jgi:hypothetical protein
MADAETPNNRATSAKDIPNSFINRSAISDLTFSLQDDLNPFALFHRAGPMAQWLP